MHYISKKFFKTHKRYVIFFLTSNFFRKVEPENKKGEKKVRNMNFLEQDLYKGY